MTGIIASANSGDITLRNGRTIFLKHGTVIDPRGQLLQAGGRISVRGVAVENGNIDAQTIRIIGDARYGDGNDDWGKSQRRASPPPR